ncbi:MAG TPA: hypothetical protein VES01_05925 [Dermatophilaceae bacterium]|nr:hypothetical protein [Dermatophilaceae bacterium]
MSPTGKRIAHGSVLSPRVAGEVGTAGTGVGIVDRLGAVPTRRLLGYLSAAVLAVPLMGLVFLTGHFATIFNIDGETEFGWPPWQTRIVIPALIASALLLCAGWCWLEISRRATVGWQRLATGSFGALVIFMTADEFFGIHEWVSQFGIRWQILYAPVALAVGVLVTVFLSVVARRGLRAPMALVLLGAAAWFVAQVLEFVEYDGRPPAPGQPEVRASLYWVYVFIEESLENVGSVLFLLAALSLAAGLTAGRWAADHLPA